MAIALILRYPFNTSPKLEHISADTLTDVQGDGFYLIRIKSDPEHPGATAP
jgi:hypothetical protein